MFYFLYSIIMDIVMILVWTFLVLLGFTFLCILWVGIITELQGAKRVMFCCVMVVVALVVGWCIPDPMYIGTRRNTEVIHNVCIQTNTREVYITRTNWISPTSCKCTTITHTVPQKVQTVTRYVKPTPSPKGKPVCPYTYPAGFKDGQHDRRSSHTPYWNPRFRSDPDYVQGYFEGFYDYHPYCDFNLV